MTLTELNHLTKDAFVKALADIFEHSPWVAEGVVDQRPYATLESLHQAMVKTVENASPVTQLQLICAHPELAGKAAIRGELTLSSTHEQQGAGLDACSEEEFNTLQQLNRDYTAKFGFPFILAVKGHNRHSIIEVFSQRLHHTPAQEKQTALEQIYKIAYFRLNTLLS